MHPNDVPCYPFVYFFIHQKSKSEDNKNRLPKTWEHIVFDFSI